MNAIDRCLGFRARRIGRFCLVYLVAGLTLAWQPGVLKADELAEPADVPGPVVSQNAYDSGLGAYFRLHHRVAEQIGQPNSYTMFGAFKPLELYNGLAFVDGQLTLDNDGEVGGSVGLGRRWHHCLSDSILGASLWYDVDTTRRDNTFQQLGVSFEWLSDCWDARCNAYAPVSDRIKGTGQTVAGDGIRFEGHSIVYGTQAMFDTSLGGVDLELARRLGDMNVWAFAGTYHFDGPGVTTWGANGGLRGYVTDNVAMSVEVAGDDLFGTNVMFGVTWFLPGGACHGGSPAGNWNRLIAPVERRRHMIIHETFEDTYQVLTDGAEPITVIHVNDTGNSSGTYEDPYGSLDEAENDPNKADYDIVYVYSGTTFSGQSYTLAPDQRLLGEGDGVQHVIQTDQFGPINLPEVNGINGPRPVINGVAGTAITANNGTEISNFDVTNSTTGVEMFRLAGNVNVNRVDITGGTIGVDISDLSTGTFTLDDVGITSPGGDGISVQGASANVIADRLTIDAAGDDGIFILDDSGTFTVNSATVNNSDTSGVEVQRSSGTYTFNNLAINGAGYAGVDVESSTGTTSFTNLDITIGTNTAGNGLVVLDGGTVNVTGAGNTIDVSGGGTPVDAENSTLGMTFDSIASNNASGLYFDGVSGSFGVTGTTTVADPNWDAIYIGGSSADFTFNQVAISGAGGDGIFVYDDTGTVTVNGGTITDSGTSGVEVLQGSGTYTFNNLAVNGAGFAGVDVENSTGTTNLANLDITIGTSTAGNGLVVLDGGTVNVTGAGNTIDVSGGGTPVDAENSTLGMTFDSIASNDASGLYFDGVTGYFGVTGTTTVADPNWDAIYIGGSSADFTFNQVAISGAGGDGIFVYDDTGTVTVNGGTITDSGTSGLEVLQGSGTYAFSNLAIDGAGFAGADVEYTAGTVNLNNLDIDTVTGPGVTLVENNAAAVNINGGTIDGTSIGIDSYNTGSLTIDGLTLGQTTAIAADGIYVSSYGGPDRTVTIQNVSSAQIGSYGIELESANNTTMVDINNNSITSTGTAFSTAVANPGSRQVISMDDNDFSTSTGVPTVRLSAGGGQDSIVVTSIDGNTVDGNGTGGGMVLTRVSFDADGDPPNGYQQVAADSLQIGDGTAANERVQGDGLSLLAPTGDLSITTLDIYNNAGTGLEVDTKSPPGPTTFNLVTGGGTIDTTGGPAMFLDPLTGDITLDSVTSTGSATINGGDTSQTASGDGNGIFVDGLTATGGAGPNALTIQSLNVSNSANMGVRLQNSTGDFTFGTVDVTDPGWFGFYVDNLGTGSSLTVDDGNAATMDDLTVNGVTSGHGVAIYNSQGSVTIEGVDIDSNAAVNFGMYLLNNTATIDVNGGTIDGFGTGVAISNSDDVTIDGLTLGQTSPIAYDAIYVYSWGATERTATIQNVTTSQIGRYGIYVDSYDGRFTVDLNNNSITSDDSALFVEPRGWSRVAVAVDDNEFETLGAAPTVRMQSSEINYPVIVTSLDGNTVHGNGTGGGMVFQNVAFDADGDLTNGIQQVVADSLQIGDGTAANQRVEGYGLDVRDSTGDLAFNTLDVFSAGGSGLFVSNAASGSTINLSVSGGTIDQAGTSSPFLNEYGLVFESSAGSLELNNVAVRVDGGFNLRGIGVSNLSATTAMSLSGSGNTVSGTNVATASGDAGGGFIGTIGVNGGADDLP